MYRVPLLSLIICSVLFLFPTGALGGERVFMKPSAFLGSVFGKKLPPLELMVLQGRRAKEVKKILGRNYRTKRIRYWKRGGESAWILDEIGKNEPITVGYHVSNGTLKQVRVLIYRESQGHEVARRSFVKQFKGAQLKGRGLDRRIHQAAGATFSTRTLTKLARLALYLDSTVAR